MRALSIVHQADAGPGVFAGAVEDAGWELVRWRTDLEGAPVLDPAGFDAVMTFGGSAHPDQDAAYGWMAGEVAWLAEVIRRGVPLLGVCLGAQLVARAAGGGARRAAQVEIGWPSVRVLKADDPLVGALAPGLEAFSWHAYECLPPPGAAVVASSERCVQAFRAGARVWGIQFHAEVSQSDALAWIDDYAADPDAVAAGVDPAALRAATEPRIAEWNAVGRGLCGRFLEVAESLGRGPSGVT